MSINLEESISALMDTKRMSLEISVACSGAKSDLPHCVALGPLIKWRGVYHAQRAWPAKLILSAGISALICDEESSSGPMSKSPRGMAELSLLCCGSVGDPWWLWWA